MVKPRKPGGGRKPAGPLKGKVSTFSTRITAETRGALEAESAASGQSISQVAERLLQLGLDLRRRQEAGDPIRALGYLLGAMAYACQSTAEDGRLCEWNTDPAIFAAFQSAVGTLLDRIRPPGEINTSIEGPLLGNSPENHGEHAFRQVWMNLHAEASSPADIRKREEDLGWRPSPDDALGRMSRNSYAMSDARRALKIRLRGETDK